MVILALDLVLTLVLVVGAIVLVTEITINYHYVGLLRTDFQTAVPSTVFALLELLNKDESKISLAEKI